MNGTVSVLLKNGKLISGHWKLMYRDIIVISDDEEFPGTYSTDTTEISVEKEAKWCLCQIIKANGGII